MYGVFYSITKNEKDLLSETIVVLKVVYLFRKIIFIIDDFTDVVKCDNSNFSNNKVIENMWSSDELVL